MTSPSRSALLKGLTIGATALGIGGAAATVALSSGDDSGEGATALQVRGVRSALLPRAGTQRVEARTADEHGAMPWAVRSWITRNRTNFCAQLGRMVNGRFGTVGADGQFRALRYDEDARCTPGVLDRGTPIIAIETFVDDPQAEEPEAIRTVVWGVAGPRGRAVTADGPGAPRRPPLDGRRRSFVALFDGDVRTYQLAVSVRTRGRRPTTLDYGKSRRGRDQPRRVAIEATTADPEGGPRWGLLVWETAGGAVCSYQGRTVAGGRVGALHGRTFTDYPVGEGGACLDRDRITREQPFAYGVSSGPRQPVVFHGIAAPAVARVRLDGPGGARELEPSARGGVLALYPAGVNGEITPTVTFEDGTTRRLAPLPLGDRRPTYPGQPRVGRIGPPVLRVSRGGLVIVDIDCPADRRGRKCIGHVSLRTARPVRGRSGLREHVLFGSRVFRIGAGTNARPLRIRLPGRARAFLRREGRVDAVAIARSDAGDLRRPQRRRVTIIAAGEPGAAATTSRSQGADVSPARGGLLSIFNVRTRGRYAMGTPADAYLVALRGPFGPRCDDVRTQRHGISWHPRYNRRHQLFRQAFAPRRLAFEDLPPEKRTSSRTDLGVWCPGTFRGSISFRRALPGRDRVRRLTTFTFTVRGPGPGERFPAPRITGLRKHDAICTLYRAGLRWLPAGDSHHPPAYRPRPGCQHSDVPGPRVVRQDPPPGTPVEGGSTVRYELED